MLGNNKAEEEKQAQSLHKNITWKFQRKMLFSAKKLSSIFFMSIAKVHGHILARHCTTVCVASLNLFEPNFN